jgi:serine/threonine protein phosphatase PrpC
MSETHQIEITSAIEQLCKGQDYTCSGESVDPISGEKFHWTMLNDGHGTNSCINFIRKIPQEKKSSLISSTTPVETLAKYIDESNCIRLYESSGATVIIVKIYKNRAECFMSGDSQLIIFKNSEIVHISNPHNCKDPTERERMKNKGYTFCPTTNIKVISESRMTMEHGEYVLFKNNNKLACTQALGHNSITGYNPAKFSIPLEKEISYRFVLGSDGLFDMLILDNPDDIKFLRTETSKNICDKATKRWLQEWEAIDLENMENYKFSYEKSQCDDVSVTTVDIKPI